jgi:hypothetical protein
VDRIAAMSIVATRGEDMAQRQDPDGQRLTAPHTDAIGVGRGGGAWRRVPDALSPDHASTRTQERRGRGRPPAPRNRLDVMRDGVSYHEPGADSFVRRDRERTQRRSIQQREALGYRATLNGAA